MQFVFVSMKRHFNLILDLIQKILHLENKLCLNIILSEVIHFRTFVTLLTNLFNNANLEKRSSEVNKICMNFIILVF